MLLQKFVFTRWNSRTKKYYQNLGYEFTFMGDYLEIRTSDLKESSGEFVLVKCDYCGEEYLVRWADRNLYMNHEYPQGRFDACKNCGWKKSSDKTFYFYGVRNPMGVEEFKNRQINSVYGKYGTDNVFRLDMIKKKIKDKNIEKYGFEYPTQSNQVKKRVRDTVLKNFGVENVFQSEEIKEKIKVTNVEKYGTPFYTQTEECKQKAKRTNNERYGADNWMQTEEGREFFTGENSPVWKGGIHDERWDRLQEKYKNWRFLVFSKNYFHCDCCKESSNELEAHHLYNWNDYPDLRYSEDNGISLCKNCHISFHKKYGKKNNNPEQYYEFRNSCKNGSES